MGTRNSNQIMKKIPSSAVFFSCRMLILTFLFFFISIYSAMAGATLYEDKNYGGTWRHNFVGTYNDFRNLPGPGGNFNDEASSIWVDSGWVATVCEHVFCGGLCYTFYGGGYANFQNLPGPGCDFNDEASSICNVCVTSQWTSCGCGTCGCGGLINCDGSCSGGDPTPSNYGSGCNCGACGCGGTINCAGSCTGSDPTPSNYGAACGSCGGTIRCDSTCSITTPSNYGAACGSCGGTIRCDSTCSIATPSNYGQSCNCGACGCGGTIRCDSSCSGINPTPSNYGQACNRNQCGGTGTINCASSCSAAAPFVPPNYGQSCGSCGGTINCAGSCSIPTPPNYGQACGNCGTIGCSSTCINQGVCSPGQVQCSGTTRQSCSLACQWGNVEDCSTKLSVDTDGSATAYTTAGTVTDYVSCSSGSCTSNAYPDSCSAKTLTEYGASAASFTSGAKNCQDYEINYCSGTSIYRQTWGCSGNPGFCNDAAVSDTLIEDCNLRDGWYCSGATREFRDYGCSSGSCTYTVTSSENCAAKLSTDTDGSATAYTNAGTVTDYVSCSSGSCTSNVYPDSCTSTTLTEYGASAASFTSGAKNCEDYEINYCLADRYYRQEWGCSGNPAFCNDAAVADTAIGTDADNDGVDAQCGDSLCDNAAGVCDNAIAGKCVAKKATETNCGDGLDNDCNGLTDYEDPQCDIGLRAYSNNRIIKIAPEIGTSTSPLFIRKNGISYRVRLVDPTDPKASNIQIKTEFGIKALMKFD